VACQSYDPYPVLREKTNIPSSPTASPSPAASELSIFGLSVSGTWKLVRRLEDDPDLPDFDVLAPKEGRLAFA
jgi:hypothetical protein